MSLHEAALFCVLSIECVVNFVLIESSRSAGLQTPQGEICAEGHLVNLLHEVGDLHEVGSREDEVTQCNSVHQVRLHVLQAVTLEVFLDKGQQEAVLRAAEDDGVQVETRQARCEGLAREDKADDDEDEQDVEPVVDLGRLHIEHSVRNDEQSDHCDKEESQGHPHLDLIDSSVLHANNLHLLLVDRRS